MFEEEYDDEETDESEEESEESSEEDAEEEVEEEEPKEPAEGYGIMTRSGQIIVQNSSEKNQIWDISGKLVNLDSIEDLDEEFYISKLSGSEEHAYDYQLKAEKEPAIGVDEFISTINNPATRSYSLIIGEENTVYFKLKITNKEKYPINNINVVKHLFEGQRDLDVASKSAGEYQYEDNSLKWTIEQLDEGQEATIEFRLPIRVESKEESVRSGIVEVSYAAENSLSGVSVEEFEAFGDNRVAIVDEQLDEQPDLYHGQLRFTNLSPYIVKAKNISVKEEGKDAELVELPEGDFYLGAEELWQSNMWEIDTQGEMPLYHKNVQFILIPQLISSTETQIEIDDIELAVAIFEAKVEYDIEVIESFREVEFNATHTLTNGGATPFDFISVKQVLPDHFRLPEKDQIVLKIDDKEYSLDPDWISIDGRDLYIVLDNLRETEIGMFQPDSTMNVIFPIIAENLSADEEFLSNVEWRANTYPRGDPIIISDLEEAVKIEVIHKRLRALRGKNVLATSDPEVYEVVLEVVNNGEFALENYLLKDRVPDLFNADDFSMKPSEHSEHDGKEVVEWVIESIAAGESVEIRYKLKPENEDARVSGAQFSM